MALYLFDTSALVKRYHVELGSPKVAQIFASPIADVLISDITVIEMHSAVAKKVRTGEISSSARLNVLSQFANDLRAKTIKVIPVTKSHKRDALRLINRYSPTYALRTLDALQLAVAVKLFQRRRLYAFVAADEVLCNIAQMEGLSVINPESP